MRTILRIAAVTVLVIVGIGTALLPVLSPAFTSIAAARFSQLDEAGLTAEQGACIAEQVRASIVRDGVQLPAEYAGRAAFDDAARSHLRDVRAVIRSALRLLAILWIVAVAAAVIAVRNGRAREVGRMLLVAGAILIGAVVVVGVWAAADFNGFFSAFHAIFFRPGTWTFPYDSLLIRLFPAEFWASAGATWGCFCIVVGIAYLLVGGVIARRISPLGTMNRHEQA